MHRGQLEGFSPSLQQMFERLGNKNRVVVVWCVGVGGIHKMVKAIAEPAYEFLDRLPDHLNIPQIGTVSTLVKSDYL